MLTNGLLFPLEDTTVNQGLMQELYIENIETQIPDTQFE